MSYADVIIKSSSIFTGLTHETIEGAVIVRGSEIIEIVSLDEAEKHVSPETRIFDCGDRLMCPGFNDAHTHFLQNGIMKDDSYTLSLEGLADKEATLTRIREFAEAHP